MVPIAPTAEGLAYVPSGSTDGINFTVPAPDITTGSFSVALRYTSPGSATNGIFQWADGTAGTGNPWFFVQQFGDYIRVYWAGSYSLGMPVGILSYSSPTDIVISRNGATNDISLYINGSYQQSYNGAGSNVTRDKVTVANGYSGSLVGAKHTLAAVWTNVAFSPFEATRLSRDLIDGLFAPQRRLWIQLGAAAGGTTAYTIDAQPGGYSISGTASTLARGLFIDAQPATYTVSGAAATIVRGYNLDAQPGTYTATGTAASLLRGYTVDAAPGSFSLTGVAATLDKVTPGVYTLDAQPGSYSLTGIAATLTYTPLNVYTLDAQPGAYVVTGAAAGLTYTGSSIWTDIGVSSTTWSDIGGSTSIWTDL
jgi:hypothetical protein